MKKMRKYTSHDSHPIFVCCYYKRDRPSLTRYTSILPEIHRFEQKDPALSILKRIVHRDVLPGRLFCLREGRPPPFRQSP